MAISDEQLSSLIGDAYTASHDQAAWPNLLENIRSAFNGSKVCVTRVGPKLKLTDVISTAFDPDYSLKFIAEYAAGPGLSYDPIAALPVGAIYNDHHLFGGTALRRSRLWNEWMVPQDMYNGLACKLGAQGSSFWILDVQRAAGRPSYDSADVQLLSVIAPHIRQAINISQNLRVPNAASAGFESVNGAAMFLDPQLKITSMNQAAESILDRYKSHLAVRSGTFSIDSASATVRLKQLIQNSCQPRGTLAAGESGGMLMEFGGTPADVGAIAVFVCPLIKSGVFAQWSKPLAIAFLQDLSLKLPEAFASRVKDIFELTTKEAKLASLLTQGLSLKKAAETEQIAFSTARTYLEAIFLKTGAHQQSQLVAILKGSSL